MCASLSLRSLRKNIVGAYPFGGPHRITIPQEFIDWCVDWPEYKPTTYTIESILAGDKPWADPEIGRDGWNGPVYNAVDGLIDRRSHAGPYLVTVDNFPLNPAGRTGIQGRGRLGRWGPNHAADCVVTRWKNSEKSESAPNERIMEFVAIVRKDTEEVALPGGMVDPGETPSTAAFREFVEEVIGADSPESLDPQTKTELTTLFSKHQIVLQTYVDDHRNTDNAWMETSVIHCHMKPPFFPSLMSFKSGSDAKEARWVEFRPTMKLYASHFSLVEKVHSLLMSSKFESE